MADEYLQTMTCLTSMTDDRLLFPQMSHWTFSQILPVLSMTKPVELSHGLLLALGLLSARKDWLCLQISFVLILYDPQIRRLADADASPEEN